MFLFSPSGGRGKGGAVRAGGWGGRLFSKIGGEDPRRRRGGGRTEGLRGPEDVYREGEGRLNISLSGAETPTKLQSGLFTQSICAPPDSGHCFGFSRGSVPLVDCVARCETGWTCKSQILFLVGRLNLQTFLGQDA